MLQGIQPCMYHPGIFIPWNYFGLCAVYLQLCLRPPSWLTFLRALFSLPESEKCVSILWKCFCFQQCNPALFMLILTQGPWAYPPGHPHLALSWWWMTSDKEKSTWGRGEWQPLLSLWQTQLSSPGLHLDKMAIPGHGRGTAGNYLGSSLSQCNKNISQGRIPFLHVGPSLRQPCGVTSCTA